MFIDGKRTKHTHIQCVLLLPMQIYQVDISFYMSVRNLSVILDQTLSFKQHVLNVCSIGYLELSRIRTIPHYLSVHATKTLVCAFVLSRIEYYSIMLF